MWGTRDSVWDVRQGYAEEAASFFYRHVVSEHGHYAIGEYRWRCRVGITQVCCEVELGACTFCQLRGAVL